MSLKIAVLIKQVPDHEAIVQIGADGTLDIEDRYVCSFFDEIAIFNVVLNDGDTKDIATKGLAVAVAVSPAGRIAATWGSVKGQLAK